MKFIRRIIRAGKQVLNPTKTVQSSTPDQLRELLKKGTVTFAFVTKGTGNLRHAIGTTKLSKIPWQKHPEGIKAPSPKVVTFFDLELSEWRSMSVDAPCFVY